jgi:hypothetical protein
MLSRRAPVAVSDAFQWLVGARFATTVAARVKSGSGAKSSSSANVLTATRVGELARLAAERYDYNDMVVSSAQNIKFTFALSQVSSLQFLTFFFFFFFFFF